MREVPAAINNMHECYSGMLINSRSFGIYGWGGGLKYLYTLLYIPNVERYFLPPSKVYIFNVHFVVMEGVSDCPHCTLTYTLSWLL